MIISVLLLVSWVVTPGKKVNLQIVCLLLLLGVLSIGTIAATNTFSAFNATTAMAIILLCICIPLIRFVDSVRKIRIFVNVLILVFLYVGIWAIFHGGNGPAGSGGAQDENYTSAMMCMAAPLAYFSIPLTPRRVIKLFYGVALAVFVAAIVVSSSRGGFLGLIGVVLFCVFNSPRKKHAVVALVIGALLLSMVAGPKYWEEMSTITDTKEATVDLRLEFWAIAWRMFVHNPVIGVGPGNWRWRSGEYQSDEQLEKFGRTFTASAVVHSTYLEILSEQGLAGAALFLTALISTFRGLWRIRSGEGYDSGKDGGREAVSRSTGLDPADSQQLRYCSLAIMGSLVGFLVPAAFVSFTYFSHVWVLIALGTAVIEVANERVGISKVTSNPSVA